MFAAVLFFMIIYLFMVELKVTELEDSTNRFIHGTGQRQSPALMQEKTGVGTEGAFSIYGKDENVELFGYTTCGGCPGENIKYVSEEMIENGAEVIHLATGFLVGYPPYIDHFKKFIEEKYDVNVVLGTHPIPEKYLVTHTALGTWDSSEWQERIKDALPDKDMRIAYN